MNRLLALITVIVLLTACTKKEDPTSAQEPDKKDLYTYSYVSIYNETIPLSKFKGKKILFVNTASLCSNTPQYEYLEELYQRYQNRLVIIGFPCNQFGNQEPGSIEEIEEFCTDYYHITFPLATKIDVKGTAQHPIYQWLTSKILNDVEDSEVLWNFQKYLVDENGKYQKKFADTMTPLHPEIIAAVEK